MPQSVYLVDDHPIVRIGLRTLLERIGYVVTGEAESAEQAFDDSMLLKVDVIILDIRLPGIDGIDLLQRIQQVVPCTPFSTQLSCNELRCTQQPAVGPTDFVTLAFSSETR